VGFVPVQLELPVTVRVAVKEPLETLGVNDQVAGSVVPTVQLPKPAPPVQFTAEYVPPADEPVMNISLVPVQVLMLAPALAVGSGSTVTVTDSQEVAPLHPPTYAT
jgi:hypothetical protein